MTEMALFGMEIELRVTEAGEIQEAKIQLVQCRKEKINTLFVRISHSIVKPVGFTLQTLSEYRG